MSLTRCLRQSVARAVGLALIAAASEARAQDHAAPAPSAETGRAMPSARLRHPKHSGGQLRAGATYRKLYDIGVFGGEAGVFGGWWNDVSGHYIGLNVMMGRTESGLALSSIHTGYRGDWSVGMARLGVSAGPGVLIVNRVTPGDSLVTAGLASSLIAGVDLLQVPGNALTLDVAFNVDLYPGDDSLLLWGPTLGLSFRF